MGLCCVDSIDNMILAACCTVDSVSWEQTNVFWALFSTLGTIGPLVNEWYCIKCKQWMKVHGNLEILLFDKTYKVKAQAGSYSLHVAVADIPWCTNVPSPLLLDIHVSLIHDTNSTTCWSLFLFLSQWFPWIVVVLSVVVLLDAHCCFSYQKRLFFKLYIDISMYLSPAQSNQTRKWPLNCHVSVMLLTC